MQVVVTGAAGKTGGLIVKKLVERSAQFEPRALVRSEKVRLAEARLPMPVTCLQSGCPKYFNLCADFFVEQHCVLDSISCTHAEHQLVRLQVD